MGNIIHIDSVVKMPLMSLPVRSTFVKIGDHGILISPGSRVTEQQLSKLPKVTDIIAPNLFHIAGVPKAKEYFPEAKVWGPKGAQEKYPNVKWDSILDESSWPYGEELQMLSFAGMNSVFESVFFHKPSKTLIATDMAFNLTKAKGLGAFIILKLFGTYRKFAVSKFFLRAVSDKTAFAATLRKILQWDFETLSVSHGELIVDQAKDKMRSAFLDRGFNI